jgi:hypothetical protein
MADVSAKCVNRPSLDCSKASKPSWGEARFPGTTFFKLAAIVSGKVVGLSVPSAAFFLVIFSPFFVFFISWNWQVGVTMGGGFSVTRVGVTRVGRFGVMRAGSLGLPFKGKQILQIRWQTFRVCKLTFNFSNRLAIEFYAFL